MLEFTYYNTKKINNLKDFFAVSFVLIDDVYNVIIPSSIQNRRNIFKSKLSDSEIIVISLVGEALTIEYEKAWFYFIKRTLKIYFLIFVIEQGLIELKEIFIKLFWHKYIYNYYKHIFKN